MQVPVSDSGLMPVWLMRYLAAGLTPPRLLAVRLPVTCTSQSSIDRGISSDLSFYSN